MADKSELPFWKRHLATMMLSILVGTLGGWCGWASLQLIEIGQWMSADRKEMDRLRDDQNSMRTSLRELIDEINLHEDSAGHPVSLERMNGITKQLDRIESLLRQHMDK